MRTHRAHLQLLLVLVVVSGEPFDLADRVNGASPGTVLWLARLDRLALEGDWPSHEPLSSEPRIVDPDASPRPGKFREEVRSEWRLLATLNDSPLRFTTTQLRDGQNAS
jgi:hypothetical protein